MKFSVVCILCLLVVAGVFWEAADGQMISLTPSDSGFTVDSVPIDGEFDRTHVSANVNIEVNQSMFSGNTRGLIEFDLQGIPSGASVSSASLDLMTSGLGGTPTTISLFGYNADGEISLADGTVPATFIDNFVVASGASEVSIDVTASVAGAIGSSTHIGFRAQLIDEEVPPTIVAFLGERSLGGVIPARVPVLNISVQGAAEDGDVNRDGFVNFSDIGPFISVLSSGGFQGEADIDKNGIVGFSDIAPFIAILTGQ